MKYVIFDMYMYVSCIYVYGMRISSLGFVVFFDTFVSTNACTRAMSKNFSSIVPRQLWVVFCVLPTWHSLALSLCVAVTHESTCVYMRLRTYLRLNRKLILEIPVCERVQNS